MSAVAVLATDQEVVAAQPAGQGSCVQFRPSDTIIREVMRTMKAFGYSDRDVMSVRLSLEEAIVNAHTHGNRGDFTKQVKVNYDVNRQRVQVQVEDEGEGFNPGQLRDPTLPENLDREHGRGVALMRTFMTKVQFNRRGNCVTLYKCPSSE